MVRVLIADPHTVARLGYAAALAATPGLELVGQADRAGGARPLVVTVQPDVVLLDADLPDVDGLTFGESLRSARPNLGLVLVGPPSDDMLFRALEERFSAYLPRSASLDVMMSAVRHAAAAPTSFTAPDLAVALGRRRAVSSALSPREAQVLRHLYVGSNNASIADKMHLTESTVRTYLARVYDKLGVRSRAEALVAATQRGLL
ncbi:response regulator transcription factor [Pilimelia columellifera]|uniref:Response regulator transcription factor n=1 Tax=Pilimelia columellifera subsp. columellifera TaxID=706583 RepID=A0ABN3MZS9_9ACTN